MFTLTFQHIVILLCIIVSLIIVYGAYQLFMSEAPLTPAGWLRGLRALFPDMAREYADAQREAEISVSFEDDWEDDAYHDPGPLPEIAVEVNAGPVYGPETFEIADMTLRLTKPHLYAADWYQACRRDFSHWAVRQWQLIDAHQREMRIGAYAT